MYNHLQPRMRKVYILFLVLLNFLWLNPLKATHIAGSDMEFQCLGNDSFRITFRIYRDCSPGNAALGSSIPVSFSPVSCSLSQVTTNFNRTAVTPIRFKCNGREWASICEGGTFPFGIEEHVYTQTVYLKQLFPTIDSNCCLIKVGWTSCCRNGAITNLVNPLTQGFTNEGVINRCITPCNSSPQFTNKPIVAICAGQPYCYNMGVVDTIDFDSLSFDFADPLGTGGVPVPFANGFSKNQPLNYLGFGFPNLPFPSGMHLDPQSGDLCFTPMGQQQPVLAIKITEWRKINGQYVKIGETRRDAQFYTWQCPPNNPPEIEVNGYRFGNWKFEVCAGNSLCLSIIARDKDSIPPAIDTTTLSWNRGIPGATFTNVNTHQKLIREDEAVFCWSPTDNQVSSLPYYFTTTAEDMACPAATRTKAVAILVRPRPLGTHRVYRINCSNYAMQMQLTNGQNVDSTRVSYQWEVSSFNTGVFSILNAKVYLGKTAEHTFTNEGTYVIRATMATPQCTTYYYDTVYVDPPLKAIAPADTFVCKGASIILSGQALNGAQPYVFLWENYSTNKTLQITPDTSIKHILIVTDSAGCKSFDTVEVSVKPLPVINLGPDKRFCMGDSVRFETGNNNGNGLIACLWQMQGKNDNKWFTYAKDSGQLIVTVTDSFFCKQSDTVNLFVNHPLKPQLGADDSLCVFDTITLKSGFSHQKYEWTKSGGTSILSTSPVLTVAPSADGIVTYILKTEETYKQVTCPQSDTINIVVLPLPAISFANDLIKNCITGSWIDFDFKTNPKPAGGVWLFNDTLLNRCINTNTSSENYGRAFDSCVGAVENEKITYYYKDKFGCKNHKSAKLTLLPGPVVFAGPDSSFCNNDNPVSITPFPNTGVGTMWSLPPSDSVLCDNCLESVVRKHTFYPAKARPGLIHLIYRAVAQNGCSNTDTLLYWVKPIPEVNAGYMQPMCENLPPVQLNALAGITPPSGTWSGPGIDQTNQTFSPKGNNVAKYPAFNILRYSFTNSVGCLASDTLKAIVYALPEVKINSLPEKICETNPPVSINATPKGAGGFYFLNQNKLTSGTFSPSRNNPLVKEGKNEIAYTYKDAATGCSNADTADLTIQFVPEITAVHANALCEGTPFAMSASMKRASKLRWTTNGDGLFGTQNFSVDSDVIYHAGATEISNLQVSIQVITTDSGVCPAARKNINLSINPKPTGDFTSERKGCEPFQVLFKGTFSDASSFIWNFGDSGISKPDDPAYHTGYSKNNPHHYLKDGVYSVKVLLRSDEGCENLISKPQWIEVFNTPVADFNMDKEWTTVALPRFSFTDKSSGFTAADKLRYSWNFGDPQTTGDTSGAQNPTYTYSPDTGTFRVVLAIKTIHGCESESEKTVNIRPDITVSAPTAFRPGSNEKGKPLCAECQNDKFYIVVDGQRTFQLTIFNRWGERVFSTNNPNEGWDGKFNNRECQQDVYAWELTLTSFNGSPYKYSGTVTLVR